MRFDIDARAGSMLVHSQGHKMFGIIRNARGERLDYTFHPGAQDSWRIVVIGHGVTGHKDRPFLVALAEGLARAELPALRVSFSGNAGSEGLFADSTISKEVGDLGAVLDALEGWTVAYAGHSMGGAVGLTRASRDARIRLLISLSAIVHTQAFAARAFGDLTPGRDLMLGKPGCVLSQAYLDDMRKIDSVAGLAERVVVPGLFVHGTADALVPIQDSHDAFARAGGSKTLVALEGADHVYEPGFTGEMVERVTEWCLAQFARI